MSSRRSSMPRPSVLIAVAMTLGSCGSASLASSLTLRSTETDGRVYAELDADGTVRIGACRIGVVRGRRFESVSGVTTDLDGDHAHLSDGRVLEWAGEHVMQRTPSGDLDVWVERDGYVHATNSAAVGAGRAHLRFDDLPAGAAERALMVAVVVYFLGRSPCDQDPSGVPDYL